MVIMISDDMFRYLITDGKERMPQEIWFNKYRIIKLLGSGGTAKVYLAEHIKLSSFRAIKCICKNHPLYELQLKEAQILKDLKHSCIPIIYDIEDDEDGSYIVEQYLEGDTLKDYVQGKDHISEGIIIHFALQLCGLIHYLHSIPRPVLYLDLKPENIIITGNTLKLIDFGSAIFSDEAGERMDYFGTKGFAAPEMYRRGKIDERCDVYGIGMLLYFMVTRKQVSSGLPELNHVDFIRYCSKDLKRIINRCLKYHPAQRYASVVQLEKQLSAIRNKKQFLSGTGPSIQLAVAGAQPRIGTTHLAFRLCNYFIHNHVSCLYMEKNKNRCIWHIFTRHEGLQQEEGIFRVKGISMTDDRQVQDADLSGYRIHVLDYGCLTNDNMTAFLQSDIKLLVLGAKEWELSYSEEVLKKISEYKDINYMFNYLDGRQFGRAVESMAHRNCYRIPYEPDPFSESWDTISLELFGELSGLCFPKKMLRIKRKG